MFTRKPKEMYQQSPNSEVTMTCDGIGQPKPSITWRKAGGGKLPKDRATIRHGNLTIVSIKQEDHGKYECVLENEIATLVAASILRVDSKLMLFLAHFLIRSVHRSSILSSPSLSLVYLMAVCTRPLSTCTLCVRFKALQS